MLSNAARSEIIRWTVDRTTLRNSCKKIDRQLAELHERYRICGNVFHLLLPVLLEGGGPAFPNVTQEHMLWNEFVVPDGEHSDLAVLRRWRDANQVIKNELVLMDRANILSDDELFERLKALYNQLKEAKTEIEGMTVRLRRVDNTIAFLYERHGWIPGHPWDSNDPIHGIRHRAWILRLPEVRYAIDVLDMSEDEAVDEAMVDPKKVDVRLDSYPDFKKCDDGTPLETWQEMFGRDYSEDEQVEAEWEKEMDTTESIHTEDWENQDPAQMSTGPPQLEPAIQLR